MNTILVSFSNNETLEFQNLFTAIKTIRDKFFYGIEVVKVKAISFSDQSAIIDYLLELNQYANKPKEV